MAFSVIDTHIQNPATRGKGTRMAHKMTAKQIKYFGSKRQRAALKARRHAPAKKRHNAAPRKPRPSDKRRSTGRYSAYTSEEALQKALRKRKKKNPSSRRRAARKNPELVSFLLGNSAPKRRKTVAHSKKKRRAASRANAGTRRRKSNRARPHHRKRSNPGMGAIGSPTTWLFGGAGALAGFVGSAALPQMILGASNTGIAGYAATAAATIGLGLLSHFLLPRQPGVTLGVISGGFANLIRRVISDQTPFGSYLSNPGMGDYMVANWGPPRMNNGLFSAMAEPPGLAWGAAGSAGGMITSSGIGIQDMADIRSARPC